jgi:hypothetical protein
MNTGNKVKKEKTKRGKTRLAICKIGRENLVWRNG